jgi:N6-L-threonylcarbamoyladenine synthase
MSIITFAIESSCDETSAAILNDSCVLSNIISSQLFHKEYGGIVPELASRAHISSIDSIVHRAFEEAEIERNDVNLVAATRGPGLIGSLLVGFNYAKGFSLSQNIPFIGIDHIESHLFSCFIGSDNVEFPFISLVVSGGHTIIFYVESFAKYSVLGQTQDDAAGEAFDKVAKMLGLEYPGGPIVDELARSGDPEFHKFPVSHIKDNEFDLSFSGIKTSVLYFLKKNYIGTETKVPVNDICASFQKAVVKSLVDKTTNAARKYSVSTIAVSGGVSANSALRSEFENYRKKGFRVLFPEKIYSTDNAAMIGYLAYQKYKGSGCRLNNNELFSNAFARFEHSV